MIRPGRPQEVNEKRSSIIYVHRPTLLVKTGVQPRPNFLISD
jgi:hypothetical protein